jgi:tetratricopeptide (TPR) repeat protein
MNKLITVIVLLSSVFILTGCVDSGNKVSDYYLKGEEYVNNYQYSLALEQYKLAINDKPDYEFAYLRAANIYMLKGEKDKAVEILDLAISQANITDDTYIERAKIDFKIGNYDQALDYYNKAISLDKNNLRSISGKIDILTLTENYEELKNLYSQIPNEMLVQEVLIKQALYVAGEDLDEALRLLNIASQGDDKKLEKLAKDMITAINEIREEKTSVTYGYANLVYLALTNQYNIVTLPLINKMIELNEYYEMSYVYKAMVYDDISKFEEAIEYLNKSLQLNDKFIYSKVLKAKIYLDLKDSENAKTTLLQISANDLEEGYLDYLSAVLNYHDLNIEQINLLETVINNDDLSNSIKIRFLHSLVRLEKLDEAKELLSQIETIKDSLTPIDRSNILIAKAYIVYKQDANKVDAISLIQEAQTLDKKNAWGHYYLSLIYKDLGEQDNYQNQIDRVYDLDLSGNISSLI